MEGPYIPSFEENADILSGQRIIIEAGSNIYAKLHKIIILHRSNCLSDRVVYVFVL